MSREGQPQVFFWKKDQNDILTFLKKINQQVFYSGFDQILLWIDHVIGQRSKRYFDFFLKK